LILGVNGVGEGSDGVENRLGKRGGAVRGGGGRGFGSGERLGELAEALMDLVEGLGAGGEKTLQGDPEIGLEDVALPAAGVFGVDVVGGGDGVAALMLGEIHGSVGDLDEFLRRGTMERIAGDTEAGGNVLLAEKRIGGNPAAQLRSQLASLLHGGLRHEDNEFVAAVAGDDIRAAAVAFEDLPDALENQVAFEVAVEIVDEFEAIQVHEDEREGTPGTGRALPFGRESFHKETVGFDAGEAVGDGLLLGFLESKGVVQRAGDQVGKGAEEEPFLFGEFDAVMGFDVKDAVKVIGVKDRQGHGGKGIGEDGPGAILRAGEGTERGGLAGARDLADEAGVEGKTKSGGAPALAALGLDVELARGVVENRDADMVVGEAVFELLGDLGQHFIGIERGDGVAGDKIQKIEMARLGALFLEEAGVFNGDAGFAGEHAKKLKMAFVEGAILIGEDAQRANGVIVGDQRNSAEGARGAQSDRRRVCGLR